MINGDCYFFFLFTTVSFLFLFFIFLSLYVRDVMPFLKSPIALDDVLVVSSTNPLLPLIKK